MKRCVWLVMLSLGIALAPRGTAADAPRVRAADRPANLIKNGGAETGTMDNWDGFTKVSADNPHSGRSCFAAQGSASVVSTEFIPVEPAKTYTLTVWMKSLGENASVAYAGYAPFDADKNPIGPETVLVTAGSETTLFEACNKDDKVLKVRAGSKWQAYESASVAFQADDSGRYADLPNRKLSAYGILKVEDKGEYWEVQLKDACGQAYPAGTKVREHASGGTYIYNALGGQTVPAQWAQYTGVIKGVADAGAPPDQWWHGTKYVKVILLLNYGQDQNFSIAVDDVSMTESAK
jgi:hypothetical protein